MPASKTIHYKANPEVPEHLKKQGVTKESFAKLVARGYYDEQGMELTWDYWRERGQQEERERAAKEQQEYERQQSAASQGGGVVLDKNGRPLARPIRPIGQQQSSRQPRAVEGARPPRGGNGKGVSHRGHRKTPHHTGNWQPADLFRGRATVKRNQRRTQGDANSPK